MVHTLPQLVVFSLNFFDVGVSGLVRFERFWTPLRTTVLSRSIPLPVVFGYGARRTVWSGCSVTWPRVRGWNLRRGRCRPDRGFRPRDLVTHPKKFPNCTGCRPHPPPKTHPKSFPNRMGWDFYLSPAANCAGKKFYPALAAYHKTFRPKIFTALPSTVPKTRPDLVGWDIHPGTFWRYPHPNRMGLEPDRLPVIYYEPCPNGINRDLYPLLYIFRRFLRHLVSNPKFFQPNCSPLTKII